MMRTNQQIYDTIYDDNAKVDMDCVVNFIEKQLMKKLNLKNIIIINTKNIKIVMTFKIKLM